MNQLEAAKKQLTAIQRQIDETQDILATEVMPKHVICMQEDTLNALKEKLKWLQLDIQILHENL